jgi:hypothetical protein
MYVGNLDVSVLISYFTALLITGFELEVHELQNCIDAIEIIARFALK